MMAGIEFFVELMELSFFYGGQQASCIYLDIFPHSRPASNI
jgi:hypothetical protein